MTSGRYDPFSVNAPPITAPVGLPTGRVKADLIIGGAVIGKLAKVAILAAFLVGLVPGVGSASVDGDCTGEATIEGVTYTPANDTPSNAIPIPDKEGVEVRYSGSVGFRTPTTPARPRYRLARSGSRSATGAEPIPRTLEVSQTTPTLSTISAANCPSGSRGSGRSPQPTPPTAASAPGLRWSSSMATRSPTRSASWCVGWPARYCVLGVMSLVGGTSVLRHSPACSSGCSCR